MGSSGQRRQTYHAHHILRPVSKFSLEKLDTGGLKAYFETNLRIQSQTAAVALPPMPGEVTRLSRPVGRRRSRSGNALVHVRLVRDTSHPLGHKHTGVLWTTFYYANDDLVLT